ncbi:MAG: endolytic transglycosylase MltG [Crocinitomicaceae bacterium]|nr:endolytic transglycosylase MltG [Crocinitomicaceae bacterium]
MKKKLLLFIASIALLVLLASGWLYLKIFSSNTGFNKESVLLYLPTGSSFDDLRHRLVSQNIINSETSFLLAARLKKFDKIKPGRYRVKKGISNNDLINMLRSGNQEAVMVKLDGVQTLPQLAGRLSHYLERDSAGFANTLLDPNVADSMGFTPANFSAMFIADTYNFLWTTTSNDFLVRMSKEYKKVWDQKRKDQAAALGMSEAEVSTLASIVKGETSRKEEAPIIAGLYLNRLRRGEPLQSDPTVIFANGLQGVERVLFSDLQIDSPYNTYLHSGLPPGPISLVEKFYIDAVLNPERHEYLFMCAQPGNTGYHNFSRTYEQHLIYAQHYRKWLNDSGINR